MNQKLPPGWVRTTISKVTVDAQQRQPLPQERFTYIDISSIDRDTKKVSSPQSLSGEQAPSRARKVVAAGDVLVSMTRPNLNAVAIIQPEHDGQIASTGFEVLRAIDIDPRWLFYLVRSYSFISTMSNLVQGALYPAVRSQDIRDVEIFLAPLNEQKRIADKLDALLVRVEACYERLDRVSIILKRFYEAILAAATSGRLTEDWRIEKGFALSNDEGEVKNSFNFIDASCFGGYQFPANWDALRLGDIADIASGITKNSKNQNPLDDEVPYLRVANVQRGYLDLREVKTIRVPRERLEDFLLKSGDILFNEGGDIDKLGRGWVWSEELERCTFQNHVFRARLHNSHFEPRFFSYYGNSRGFDYFLSYGKQTTNLASINRSVLTALPVVIPPAEEQHEIVHRVEALFAYADRLETRCQAARAQVEQLTPSLLAKAFRGELVPQDANDESALVLLERIRAARATQLAKSKRAMNVRKPNMTKMTEETVKEAIRRFPKDRFSFDELRESLPGDYESLKDIVFALLNEDEAELYITQVFDQDANAMRFVRRHK